MKVVVYTPGYNHRHRVVLEAMAQGIPGAIVRPMEDGPVEADVAVLFGLVKDAYRPTYPKAPIIKSTPHLLLVESAFVGRGHYWRVCWWKDGVSDYKTSDVSSDRWDALVEKGITGTKPWRYNDGPVIVCGQLARDTNVQHTDHYQWCRKTVRKVALAGYNVLFRPHPREKNVSVYGVKDSLLDTRPLIHSLREAHAFVVYNSNSGVDAALYGVPVVACAEDAFCRPVASRSFRALRERSLRRPPRGRWLAGLGYSQWSLDEMREGLPWRHLQLA